MMTPSRPLSPAAAYRADTAGRSAPFGFQDDAWLVIASELHVAAAASGDAWREALYGAIGSVIDLFGDEFIDAHAEREWKDDLGYVEALMVLADVMQEAGAFNLAACLLDDLLAAATDITKLQRGRILAQRARLDWRLDRLDDATERYEAIHALGRRIRSPELKARAANGLSAIAQQRGNYPDMALHSSRAAAIAEKHGYPAIARVAHYGLMVVSAKHQNYSQALREGWIVWTLSRGHELLEAEILQNMGQLLLEAGHSPSARSCFASAVTRTRSPALLLPALGGLALASARSNAEATVEWSVREIWRAQTLSVTRYDLATALVEAAIALSTVQRLEEAARYREAGASIARAAGFHEIVFRTESIADPSAPTTPAPLDREARRVVDDLRELEPGELPEHVTYEEVTA
jgi:tetratricopeptide (TPR) repeat protein